MNKRDRKEKSGTAQKRWVLVVVALSFVLSVLMSVLTSFFVQSAGLLMALLSLLVLIALGIVTDMIGTAFTSADEQPLIAMSSKRIPGARAALSLVRKADRVSSILNDVVGDIVGIIAGTAGTVIAGYLIRLGLESTVAAALITAFTSAFMIGGKAYGKGIAIAHSEKIVLVVGRLIGIGAKQGGKQARKDGRNRKKPTSGTRRAEKKGE